MKRLVFIIAIATLTTNRVFANDVNPLAHPFANAVLPVAPDFASPRSRFKRQGCPNLTLLCPGGRCCSYDNPCCGNTCCASGYLCTGGTASAPCCVAISSPTNTCGTSNPCSRPGDLPCQGINICCPPNNSCYYDSSGAARCSPRGTPNSGPFSTPTSPYLYSSSSYQTPYIYSSYSYAYSASASPSTTSSPVSNDVSSSSNFSSTSTSKKLSPGVIAGIVIGTLAGVTIIALIVWRILRPPPTIVVSTSENEDDDDTKSSIHGDDEATKDAAILKAVKPDFVGPFDANAARMMYGALQKGDIRVLEILKGGGTQKIRCCLWLHTIEPQPSLEVNQSWLGYEALSYVWSQKPRDPSNEGKRAVISVVNPARPDAIVDFVVGWNLHQALKFLRQTDDSRVIWTDLICINQDEENKEKMSQVLMMTDIYAKATQVQVWLGPSFPASQMAAAFFAPLEGKILDDNDLLLLYRSSRAFWEHLFVGFQDRPWWTRAWTIQEVMTCPNPTLNSGQDNLSLNLVLRLITFAHEHELDIIPQGFAKDFKHRFATVELCAMRERMKTVRVPPLPEWFATFHKQSATNPRDRIFAYLGLAREALPYEKKTGYQDSIDKVWAEGTKLAMDGYNNLDFICLARGGEPAMPGYDWRPRNPEERGTEEKLTEEDLWNLPSWVPNFRAKEGDGETSARRLPLLYYPRGQKPAFNACGAVRSVLGFNDELTELQVNGVKVDKIKIISDVNTDFIKSSQGDHFMMEIAQIYAKTTGNCWSTCNVDTCTHYPGPKGGSCGIALLKTVVMDLDFDGNRLPPEGGIHTIDDQINQPPNTFGLGIADNTLRVGLWNQRMQDAKSQWSRWRRFIVTERGYIGLANAQCEIGDGIYVLAGATVPYILRDAPSKTQGARRTFRFIGESYVHGFMDGELGNALWSGSDAEKLILV